MDAVFDQMRTLKEDNWKALKEILYQLDVIIGKNPSSSMRRVLESRDFVQYLGYSFSPNEHQAFLDVLNSSYGEHIVETFKRRSIQYISRLLRLLERFPDPTIDQMTKMRWETSIKGLLRDMGALDDSNSTLKQVEDFAKSTLELTRFTATWHDPELVTALYLLEMSDKEGRGITHTAEEYLLGMARRELEVLIDPSSKNFFSSLLDDEANIWWGLLTLLDWKRENFVIYQYSGMDGFLKIIDRLLSRNSITYPKGKVARKEITFEIQSEQKTVLFIGSAAFQIADIIQDNEISDYPMRIRNQVLEFQKPFLFGQKMRQPSHLYFRCLESEVWGRMLAWKDGKGMLDERGISLRPGSYVFHQ
ncbi:MAG: hypothetical protein HZB31_11280 [Nitrospirae bacterium]|nr:hypothetical protein [Nitrospirota bacterium]